MPSINESFTLFLAPWQTRMAKDFLDLTKVISRVIIKPGVIICPASYKIPDRGLSKGDWVLYLTDEQMRIVKDKLKLKAVISGLNVTKELINKGSIVFR